jgi:hypothetical protein
MSKTSFLLLVWSVLFMTSALSDPGQDKDIEVKVQIAGENVVVDVTLAVPASRQEVWAVLTDFEHMGCFCLQREGEQSIEYFGKHAEGFSARLCNVRPDKFSI